METNEFVDKCLDEGWDEFLRAHIEDVAQFLYWLSEEEIYPDEAGDILQKLSDRDIDRIRMGNGKGGSK